jgi:hypothetical protein
LENIVGESLRRGQFTTGGTPCRVPALQPVPHSRVPAHEKEGRGHAKKEARRKINLPPVTLSSSSLPLFPRIRRTRISSSPRANQSQPAAAAASTSAISKHAVRRRQQPRVNLAQPPQMLAPLPPVIPKHLSLLPPPLPAPSPALPPPKRSPMDSLVTARGGQDGAVSHGLSRRPAVSWACA